MFHIEYKTVIDDHKAVLFQNYKKSALFSVFRFNRKFNESKHA